LLDGLNLHERLCWRLFETFLEADADWSNELSLEEMCNFFSLPQTRFLDRLFVEFDSDGSGELDFLEFACGIWNVATMDDIALARFCFELVGDAPEHSGVPEDEIPSIGHEPTPLSLHQCDSLYRMLTNLPEDSSAESNCEPETCAIKGMGETMVPFGKTIASPEIPARGKQTELEGSSPGAN